MAEQTSLSLTWFETPEDTFSHGVAHLHEFSNEFLGKPERVEANKTCCHSIFLQCQFKILLYKTHFSVIQTITYIKINITFFLSWTLVSYTISTIIYSPLTIGVKIYICFLHDLQLSQSMAKPTKWPEHPAKTQISLHIYADRSSSLSTQIRCLEKTDQTAYALADLCFTWYSGGFISFWLNSN